MEQQEKCYVLDNVEVKLTGRKATKVLKSGTIDMLYEVTPAQMSSGTWKKWVLMSALYEVSDE